MGNHGKSVWILTGLAFSAGTASYFYLPLARRDARVVAGVALAALLAFIVPAVWNWFVNTITSKHFAARILTIILILSVAGTLIPQNAAPEKYTELYGASGAEAVFFFGFHNLFQSPLFIVCLTLVGIPPLIFVFARRKLKKRSASFHIIHIAVLIVLIGGLIGKLKGDKGIISLYKGQKTSVYESFNRSADCLFNCAKILREGADNHARIRKPLPFTLRLDEFKVNFYKDKGRLYLYQYNRSGNKGRPLFSMGIRRLSKGVVVPGSETRLSALSSSEKNILILEIRNRGRRRSVSLDSLNPRPVKLNKGSDKFLIFEKKTAKVREYVAKVTILEQGNRMEKREIRVNHPFSRKGFYIYQFSYDPNQPDYSVFQVVYYPGLPVARAGFVLLVIGAAGIMTAGRPRG